MQHRITPQVVTDSDATESAIRKEELEYKKEDD
jgi:hypothetical protein